MTETNQKILDLILDEHKTLEVLSKEVNLSQRQIYTRLASLKNNGYNFNRKFYYNGSQSFKVERQIVLPPAKEGLTINIDSNTVYYKDKIIELSKNEFRILLILIQNKGKVVSREKLMNQLWKTDIFIDENTLTVNVNRLRKKLSNQGIGDLIKTKFGVGYIVE